MTYNAGIPVATTSPALFPALAQANWTRLEAIITADHQFNASMAANDGYHNLVHMQVPVTLPTGAAANLGRLYVKTAGSYVQLFYMDSNGVEYRITPGILAAVNFDGTGANGPQAIRGNAVNVSSVVKTGTGRYTVNFSSAIANVDYVVSLTGMRDSDNVSNGQVAGDATYGNSVTLSSLKIVFNGQSNDDRDVLMGNVLIYGTV